MLNAPSAVRGSSGAAFRFLVSGVCAVAMLAVAVAGQPNPPPPWVLGDEHAMMCYNNSAVGVYIPTPNFFVHRWVFPPPVDFTTNDLPTVTYETDILPGFFTDAYNIELLGGVNSSVFRKYSDLCQRANNTACAATSSSQCCTWHSNLHSCRSSTGYCEPWVGPSNGTTGETLVTHTPAQVGGTGRWINRMRLPSGSWTIIGHVKIMNFQCAVGARRTVGEATIKESSSGVTHIVAPAVLVPIVVIGLAVLGGVFVRRRRAVTFAPKDPSHKFCAMFVSLKKETLLWDLHPTVMPHVTAQYTGIVSRLARAHGCYLARTVSGSILVVAKTAACALLCAAAIAKELESIDWTKMIRDRANEFASSSLARGVLHHRAGRDNSSSSGASYRRTENATMSEGARSGWSETRSEASTQRSRKAAVSCEFTIGIHCDNGRITYQADSHTYDYCGPAIDGAAVVADTCCPGQVLVSDAVDQTDLFNGCFIEFARADVAKREATLFQFNPPGVKERTFVVADRCDSQVDSIAATLEQQTAGVTAKRVTVLSAMYLTLASSSAAMTRPAAAAAYAQRLGAITTLVQQNKGHVQSFCGGRLIVSFNAASPTPQAARRAVLLADALIAHERTHFAGEVRCGVHADTSLVGAFVPGSGVSGGGRNDNQSKDLHHAVFGMIAEQATALERLAGRYEHVNVLATGGLLADLTVFAACECIDFVRFTGSTKATTLVAVREIHPEVGEPDEWMYTLEAKEGSDVFHGANSVYDLLVRNADFATVEAALASLPTVACAFDGGINVERLVRAARAAGDVQSSAAVVAARIEERANVL